MPKRSASSVYPKRDQFHAHRLVRLLAKDAAAQEIGAEAALMVAFVAHQEDTTRYTRPVTFYLDQWCTLLGVSRKATIVEIRKMAIGAGWLHYESGGTRRAGVYWSLIPDRLADTKDTAIDEGLWTVEAYRQGVVDGKEQAYKAMGIVTPTATIPKQSRNNTVTIPKQSRNEYRNPSSPSPIPSPVAAADDTAPHEDQESPSNSSSHEEDQKQDEAVKSTLLAHGALKIHTDWSPTDGAGWCWLVSEYGLDSVINALDTTTEERYWNRLVVGLRRATATTKAEEAAIKTAAAAAAAKAEEAAIRDRTAAHFAERGVAVLAAINNASATARMDALEKHRTALEEAARKGYWPPPVVIAAEKAMQEVTSND